MESLSLLFKVLWAPGKAMFLISKKPRILVPLLFLCGLSLVVGLVSLVTVDFGDLALRQLEQSGQAANMPAEQKEAAVRISRTFAPAFVAFGALTPALITILATVIYFGIFTIIGREANFKTFYSLTLFSYIPMVVRQVVAIIQLLAVPPQELDINNLGSLSPQMFLDPTSVSKAVYAFSSVVDVSSIWIMILLCIGYKFALRKGASSGLRIAAVVGVYMFFALIIAGLRLLQTA
jgi:hypothetical protein